MLHPLQFNKPLAEVVRIDRIVPHPDPNTHNIELVTIGWRQLVVQKGQFRLGDYGILIRPGAVVPQTPPFAFLWGPHQDPSDPVGLDNPVPARRRRIASRKFRKAWSSGLLIPVNEFWEFGKHSIDLSELVGADASRLLGITEYVPNVETKKAPKTKRKYPRSLKGWVYLLTYKLSSNRPEPSVERIPSYILPFFR